MPTEQHRRTRRSRPAVLDAARTAAIPLRPLTMVEILDSAFVVLRRRPGVMIGLPVVVVLAFVAQSLGLTVGIWLLGELRSSFAQVAIGVLGVLMLTVVLVAAVMWVDAVLTRVSLEVLMGPGFAPAPRRLHLRTMLRMTPAIIGLSLVQLGGVWLIQSGVGMVSYLFLPILMIPDPATQWLASMVLTLVLLVITCWAYSYLAMAVPAYMVENGRTPAWIGKPLRPTTVFGAYGRSFALVGFRRAYRPALVLTGTVVICLAVFLASLYGVILLALSLIFTIASSLVTGLLANIWFLVGAAMVAQVLAGTVSIAFLSAVQCVLYLDLRMRREGLDLALRFDELSVPQPVPPVRPAPPVAPATPLRPGGGPAPTGPGTRRA